MPQLSASQQKLLKTIHLLAAGLWLSSVIILMLLPLLSRGITSGDEIYMYNRAYHFIDMLILTPAAIVTFLTGLIYSLFTQWGFVRHGWIIYKWIITLLIIITGTFYLGPMVTKLLAIADAKRIVALQDSYYIQGEVIGLSAAIINSLLLIVAVLFSVYKPWKNVKR
ncbi:hypothetical protein SAMN05660420_00830 [Desulfuromusa kysingii]|uniref:DUF2269 domain-containing protein n=1 Tax=Desulfuromusa kysingii TaxID=37625 RepID=A0A1H3X5N3_9BACT|nr:hypothetical protein [Desulfuromusa kysingii]SDZ94563.1 hypothetical protein SAMN05660420_00830 [Desulfuromusa kysingii]